MGEGRGRYHDLRRKTTSCTDGSLSVFHFFHRIWVLLSLLLSCCRRSFTRTSCEDDLLACSKHICSTPDIDKLVSVLLPFGRRLGMTAEPPAKPSKWRPYDDPGCVLEEQRKASPKLQVLSVGPGRARKSSPSYSPLKNIAESVLGIVTQCVTGQNVPKRCNPSTIVNILQKLNAKLGGTNNTTPAVKTIIFNTAVMTIGADVTHPAPTEMNRPSAAAAVASVDCLACRYISTFRIQKQNTVAIAHIELIEDMKNITRELLVRFYRINNGVKPANIFYRDGVSEGQFSQGQQHEVVTLQEANRKLHPDYEPVVTFLDVRMRQHHTRFMPRDHRDSCGKSDDTPPTAVVDTFVTQMVDFDLFLYSRFGIQGTTWPAQFYVIWDDNDFYADTLQRLTFYLCHTYVLCARSVPIPTPVYYAHNVF
ncbi:hypothetical protein HPB48_001468 [Haemaphysalis longicornis]|uniref:Piwi domain-containing protein n=1 Tax=Haemaphysalis longicornis TaxID=44386 RepID=A0A9J6FFV9_HAELO|nr:hypothetical protein HPB48_001468 [Haemaphysalis longicornis]